MNRPLSVPRVCIVVSLFRVCALSAVVFRTVTLAQITITSADASAINAVGNVITNHLDSTVTSINIGSPGSTSWDFSALNALYTNAFTSVVPSSTPYYLSDFPTSNVVFRYKIVIDVDTADGWQYSTQNPGNYLMNGVVTEAALGFDTLLVKAGYSPAQLDLPLPFTFNSQWGGDFTITNTTYFNGVPFTTTTANHTETVLADAYGPMTMPGGTVLQALRVRRDDRYTSPSPPFYVRTISYSFMTKSGAAVEVAASDTASSNSGVIQTSGVTWSSSNTTGVEHGAQIPTQYSLAHNYPNPFNPSTKIGWQSPTGSWQTLRVYDVLGNEVATLVDEYKSAGVYEVDFSPTDLASGAYFYRLQAGDFVETKTMLLIK